ncbi:MAG: hypothetical protein QME14_03675 [Methanobacteriaceae archaeon]|nr:hypothetical protein [Methanobacteriaceae archaeon]
MSETFNSISKDALNAFISAGPYIIKETVKRSMQRKNEVEQHGDDAEQILTTGMEFTTRMLETAMALGEISILEDELRWARDRLPHDKVSLEHILKRFKIYRDVINDQLDPEYSKEIIPFLDWMIKRQKQIIEEQK